ncbi:hypothetical protein [Phaeodactylibacter xiamenensis]|jgi:hypothetical protein|uniref:hypothetical protein n=1 Tax=Phaeodactylibacter xiamenensis TaxID=1524460 RepID=UPI0024A86C36|nr:hypothetical protein [Phaeodactylibacter xiamenensis]
MIIEAAMPMRPYLKRYVEWKENIEPGGQVDITNSNSEISWVLGGVLMNFIQNQNCEKKTRLPKDYSDKLWFTINPFRFNANMIYFNELQIRYFNTYVYRRLHYHLSEEIERHIDRGVPEIDTIWKFIWQTGIEGMISPDALVKANYRLRKSQKMALFR